MVLMVPCPNLETEPELNYSLQLVAGSTSTLERCSKSGLATEADLKEGADDATGLAHLPPEVCRKLAGCQGTQRKPQDHCREQQHRRNVANWRKITGDAAESQAIDVQHKDLEEVKNRDQLGREAYRHHANNAHALQG